jgi:hypothetical protein
MKLYNYKNYREYEDSQKAAYHRKFNNIWAKEENIEAISNYIISEMEPECALCHGVRQGYEIQWFKKYIPGLEVTGTDIGGSVHDNIIEWDFNVSNSDWLHRFDFIYSNSFDHAYDPAHTFGIWTDQLKPGGMLILEYDRRQEHTGEISKGVNKTDPVSIKFEELISLIPKWIYNFAAIKILNMPVVTQEWRKALIVRVI